MNNNIPFFYPPFNYGNLNITIEKINLLEKKIEDLEKKVQELEKNKSFNNQFIKDEPTDMHMI